MDPTSGLLLFLSTTVALLAAVTWTGLTARRLAHLVLVGLTLASLGVAIAFAKELGTLYDLEAAGAITPIHLTLAKVTTALYLLPLTTGVLTLIGKDVKRWHRLSAFTVLALTLLATLTGAWMILAAERL